MTAARPRATLPAPTDAYFIHAAERPMISVYSWARDSVFTSAFPGDEIEIPYDAAKIDVAAFVFRHGMIRHIHFDAGTRTHPNVAHEDILFYQISGRRVQIINDRSSEVNVGDVSLQLAGVRKRQDQIIGGNMVEFAMRREKRDDVEGQWIKAGEISAAEITDPGGSRYRRTIFPLDRYALHEMRLPRGTRLAPAVRDEDTYFFLVEGRLRATIGGVTDTMATFDAIQAPGATPFAFDVLDDTLLLSAGIPRA